MRECKCQKSEQINKSKEKKSLVGMRRRRRKPGKVLSTKVGFTVMEVR